MFLSVAEAAQHGQGFALHNFTPGAGFLKAHTVVSWRKQLQQGCEQNSGEIRVAKETPEQFWGRGRQPWTLKIPSRVIPRHKSGKFVNFAQPVSRFAVNVVSHPTRKTRRFVAF